MFFENVKLDVNIKKTHQDDIQFAYIVLQLI